MNDEWNWDSTPFRPVLQYSVCHFFQVEAVNGSRDAAFTAASFTTKPRPTPSKSVQ
jgi:hypothetical protein